MSKNYDLKVTEHEEYWHIRVNGEWNIEVPKTMAEDEEEAKRQAIDGYKNWDDITPKEQRKKFKD